MAKLCRYITTHLGIAHYHVGLNQEKMPLFRCFPRNQEKASLRMQFSSAIPVKCSKRALTSIVVVLCVNLMLICCQKKNIYNAHQPAQIVQRGQCQLQWHCFGSIVWRHNPITHASVFLTGKLVAISDFTKGTPLLFGPHIDSSCPCVNIFHKSVILRFSGKKCPLCS